MDALVLPTAPTVYTVEQVLADPVQLNSRLGTYTDFVNLLNLCGVSVPAALRSDKTPFGITLLAPAGRDAYVASIFSVLFVEFLALVLSASPINRRIFFFRLQRSQRESRGSAAVLSKLAHCTLRIRVR